MLTIEKLKIHLRDAAISNPEVQAAPACILWPDKDRQWEAVIPRLQIELPELLVLGDYKPEKRTGPAIWLFGIRWCPISSDNIPYHPILKQTPCRRDRFPWIFSGKSMLLRSDEFIDK